MKDVEEFCPKDRHDWRKWLKEYHKEKDAIWLIFYKKKSAQHNLNWSESVDEALCFGWIDSVKKSIDEERFKQYFSKRKPKSNWSRVNKDKVKVLIEKGWMKEAGLKTIEVAKANKSWIFLDQIEALIVTDDLSEVLEMREGAFEFFQGLSKSMKKQLLYWVVSTKRKETRGKRILAIAENASKNRKPKGFV